MSSGGHSNLIKNQYSSPWKPLSASKNCQELSWCCISASIQSPFGDKMYITPVYTHIKVQEVHWKASPVGNLCRVAFFFVISALKKHCSKYQALCQWQFSFHLWNCHSWHATVTNAWSQCKNLEEMAKKWSQGTGIHYLVRSVSQI